MRSLTRVCTGLDIVFPPYQKQVLVAASRGWTNEVDPSMLGRPAMRECSTRGQIRSIHGPFDLMRFYLRRRLVVRKQGFDGPRGIGREKSACFRLIPPQLGDQAVDIGKGRVGPQSVQDVDL